MEKRIEVVEVDVELANACEEADYEYNSKKDVIATYINSGLDTSLPTFIKYQEELQAAYKKFMAAKSAVEQKYILSKYKDCTVTWSLNYATNELTLTIL